MWQMIYPIAIIVFSNVLYNICSKSVPSKINPFVSLTVTYAIAAVFSFAVTLFTSRGKHSLSEFGKINWATLLLGIVIVGLELGYVLAYRNGWAMNKVSVTANITLAAILVVVSAVMYKETITLRQILGIAVCAGGLVLISI